MPKLKTIQWKALLMLVSFSLSFTLFCHCAAMAASAAPHCTHCHKKSSKQGDESGCQGMQAIKFNLLEKQTVDHIEATPAPVIALLISHPQPTNTALPTTEKRKLPQQWSYRHSPPNILSLYQRFLI